MNTKLIEMRFDFAFISVYSISVPSSSTGFVLCLNIYASSDECFLKMRPLKCDQETYCLEYTHQLFVFPSRCFLHFNRYNRKTNFLKILPLITWQ